MASSMKSLGRGGVARLELDMQNKDEGKNEALAMVPFDETLIDLNLEGLKRDDDVIDIDIASAREEMKDRWMAVGQYYSDFGVNTKSLFKEMSIIWGLKSPAMVRDIA